MAYRNKAVKALNFEQAGFWVLKKQKKSETKYLIKIFFPGKFEN